MKHGNSFYMELTREIFTEKYVSLSNGAKWLFIVLNELEQRYTGKGQNYFFRTDEELAKDANISINTLQKYKAELRKTDLIEISYGHWKDNETGKKSEKKFTCYTIKK